MDHIVAFQIALEGKVQGVGFRAFTERQALRFNINGWVRNVSGGSVEIHAEGREQDMDNFWKQIKTGPANAYVEKVARHERDPKGLKTFEIRY